MSTMDYALLFGACLALLLFVGAGALYSLNQRRARAYAAAASSAVASATTGSGAATPPPTPPPLTPSPPPTPKPVPVATPRVTLSRSTSWFGWILIIGLVVGVIYLVSTKDSRQVSAPAPQATARIADLIVLPPGEGQVDIKFTLSASELDRDVLSMYQDPEQGWQQIRLFVNGSQDPSWQWHALTGKGIARYRGIKKFLKAGENVLTIQHRLEKKPVVLKNIFLDKT